MECAKWKVGLHLLEFEPPDVFHCHPHGFTTIDQIKETIRVLEQEVVPRAGLVFFFLHMRGRGGSFSPETRSYLASLTPLWKATVFIGANLPMRVGADLVMRMLNLLTRSQAPTRAVATLEEAYAIANQLRAAGSGPAEV